MNKANQSYQNDAAFLITKTGGIIMPKLKGSYTNILNKLITDKNISKAEFRILCYLLMRAGNQDICYSNTNFSKKWLSKIPDTILEREVASGICRVKLKI